MLIKQLTEENNLLKLNKRTTFRNYENVRSLLIQVEKEKIKGELSIENLKINQTDILEQSKLCLIKEWLMKSTKKTSFTFKKLYHAN